MNVRLGINTCFAVKRWPRPEDWALVVRDRIGLSLVQHSLDLVDLSSPLEPQASAIRTAVADAGLALTSTFTGLAAYSANLLLDPDPDRRAAAAGWYERAIELTAGVGASATGGHVGAFSVPEWTDPDVRGARWGELRAALRSLAGSARSAGLGCLVVENLAAAREPSTMAMIEELLADGDDARVPIRLCLDVGHMCVPGTSGDDRDPYAWLRRFAPRAPMVQLQQSDADGDHHWPFTPDRNLVGRIDADLVIEALGEGGARDVELILEVIPPFEQDDDDVLADLVASADYWGEALARRGLATA